MSDGPHRSLPLPPPWRNVLRCAEIPARSQMETIEAAEYALAEDCRQLPELLLHPWLVQPDLVMDGGPGPSALGNIVIDHIRRLQNGAPPNLATHQRALASALSDFFRRRILSIEEHCRRHRNDRRARRALARIREIGREYDSTALAKRLARSTSEVSRAPRPPKRKGLEEGPEL